MTKRRAVADLPGWPRLLTRDLAAAYVGVSPSLFDLEVQRGTWPPPIPRSVSNRSRNPRLTWDRLALDRRLDGASTTAPNGVTTVDDWEARRAADRRARENRQADPR